MTDERQVGEDFDEAFCDGDPTLDDIDPASLTALSVEIDRIRTDTADRSIERSTANLALLSEMYGDDLVVL